MKTTRKILLVSLISAALTIGVAVFLVYKVSAPSTQGASSSSSGGVVVWVIPLVVVIAGLSLLPFLRILFPRVIRNGVRARATVLKVWDTGVSINDNPQVGLLLEVQPEDGAPFQAETKKVVSRLNAALIQPGVKAKVVFDPSNPRRVEVQSFEVESGGAGKVVDTEARLRELKNLREQDLVTEEEYQKKKEEILKGL
jgi:hypothetical protein